jgi:hypothetical protein
MGSHQTKNEEQVVVENINAGNNAQSNAGVTQPNVSLKEVILISITVSVIIVILIQCVQKKCKKQLEKHMQKYIVEKV